MLPPTPPGSGLVVSPAPSGSRDKAPTSPAERPERPLPSEFRKGIRNPFLRKIGFGIVSLILVGGAGYSFWLGSNKPPSRIPPLATPGLDREARIPKAPATVENQGTLNLSPTMAVVQVESGGDASSQFLLTNNTKSELTFEIEALDMVVREGKSVFVSPGASSNSIAATAVLSQKYLNSKPGEKTSLTVTFSIHPQTGSRGVLILLKGTDKATFGGNTTLTPTLGAFVAVVEAVDKGSSASGVEPGPLSKPSDYAIMQWGSIGPSIDSVTSKKNPDTASIQSASGTEAGSIQGGNPL